MNNVMTPLQQLERQYDQQGMFLYSGFQDRSIARPSDLHLDALKASGFRLARGNFVDTDGSVFFARQLEYIEAQTYEIIYQELTYNNVFPVDTSVPLGAASITYYTYDKVGKAEWIGPGTQDLPRADVSGKPNTTPTRWAGNSFGYNEAEIAAARFAGTPLDNMRAAAARRAVEEKFNTTAYFGDSDVGLVGLFTSGNGIPRSTAPDGASTSPLWANKTADEILSDINILFSTPHTTTLQAERPDTLLLPTAQYEDIVNRRIPDTETTIYEFIRSKRSYLRRIISVPELTGAGAGGVDVAVALTYSPIKLQFRLIQDVTFHPVQRFFLNYVVCVTGVTGGLTIRYPKSAYILEDI